MQPMYYSYQKKNQKIMAQLFFFPAEKIFGRNFLKKYFQKKKLNKKVVLAGSLANFLSRIKVPRGKTDFGGPFLSRKSRKMHALSLLCYAKNRCLSNFCVLLFCRQNLLQKSREDKPRSCFAKFACSNQVTSKRPPTVSSLLLYRCCYYGSCSCCCSEAPYYEAPYEAPYYEERLAPKRLATKSALLRSAKVLKREKLKRDMLNLKKRAKAKRECNLDKPRPCFAARCVVVCRSKRLTTKHLAPKR